MINIINKHKYPTKQYPPNTIYVGRGSPLGNPTPIDATHTRNDVCDKYHKDMLNAVTYNMLTQVQADELNKIHALHKAGETVHLACYCYPKRCHAETIKEIIENA